MLTREPTVAGSPKPRTRIKTHQQQAAQLVRLADMRRHLIVESWQRFDALDGQTKVALDGSWKILGRVITRQSLVAVSRQLDPLRRDLTRLAVPGEYEESVRQDTLLNLDAFARALQQSEPSLVRAQGAKWVGQLRDHFKQLSFDESALLETDQSRGLALKEFLASNRAITAQTQTLSKLPGTPSNNAAGRASIAPAAARISFSALASVSAAVTTTSTPRPVA